MYVIYHSSDEFGIVTAVSIVSLLENNRSLDHISILYIERNMKDQTKDYIRQMVESYGREIQFMSMPNWSEKIGITLKSCKQGWLGFGYNRLFLTEIVPDNVDRVLYLDSDTLIEGDITYLEEINLNNYYFAAVDDCLSKSYKDLVEITDKSTYCNAGVLLINVKKWREDNVIETIKKYVKEREGYFIFNEQSVLNSVFAEKILVLPCKYNVTSLVYSFSYDDLMKLRVPNSYSYSKTEYEEAKNNPVITHFTGCFYNRRRPWIKNSDHPHAKFYDYYYDIISYENKKYFEDKRSFTKRFMTNICHVLPKFLVIAIVGYLYTDLRVKKFKREIELNRNGK